MARQIAGRQDAIEDHNKGQLFDTDGRIEAVEKPISELDESVPRAMLQGGIQEHIVEELIDVFVPQVMKETVEVVQHIPQERVQNCALAEIVDVPHTQIREETGR